MRFILFLMLLSSCIFAQSSYFNLCMYDESEFYIIFDSISYSDPGNYAEIDNVSPGEHKLKVIRYDASMSAEGNVIFEGSIKIPAGFDIYAVIDEYNNLSVYKKVKYMLNRCDCASDTRIRIGDKSVIKKDVTDKGLPDECKNKVIKRENFKDLKSSINSRNFESTNTTIVKEAIDLNYFTSEQVLGLLSYFTFEDSKLEIAKYSYKKICDKNNFFKVYDAFKFESSVEELKNYISGK